jgi:hypothetical protein
MARHLPDMQGNEIDDHLVKGSTTNIALCAALLKRTTLARFGMSAQNRAA